MRSVATGRTPVPICNPVGRLVCCDELAPGWRIVWYSRSSNTARERLNPDVLTLARLLEMTSSCVCCASRPVLAIHRERIIGCSSGFGASVAAGQQLRRVLLVLVHRRQRLHLHV